MNILSFAGLADAGPALTCVLAAAPWERRLPGLPLSTICALGDSCISYTRMILNGFHRESV